MVKVCSIVKFVTLLGEYNHHEANDHSSANDTEKLKYLVALAVLLQFNRNLIATDQSPMFINDSC